MFEEGRGDKNRRSIRLPGYDYSQAGAYFVTICTDNRRCLFGRIVDGQVSLNNVGRVVEAEWLRTPRIRPQVELDAYVVMPNHLHGIIVIDSGSSGDDCPGSASGRMQYAPTPDGRSLLQSPSRTAGAVVRGFKAATTSRIARVLRARDIVLWQRNYYEHVIRDEDDLNRIREYIVSNPARWTEDTDNPNKM